MTSAAKRFNSLFSTPLSEKELKRREAEEFNRKKQLSEDENGALPKKVKVKKCADVETLAKVANLYSFISR